MQWVFNKVSDDPCSLTLRKNIKADPKRIKVLKYNYLWKSFVGYISNRDNNYSPIQIKESIRLWKLIKQDYILIHKSRNIWVRKDAIVEFKLGKHNLVEYVITNDRMFPVLAAALTKQGENKNDGKGKNRNAEGNRG